MTLQQKLLAKQSKKGFTLVELVVVIAILAILAAIAIPAVIGIINSATTSGGQSDASTLNNAAKEFYAGVTSGTINNNNKGGVTKTLPEPSASTTARKSTADTLTVADAQKYSGLAINVEDMVYVSQAAGSYTVGTILFKEDPSIWDATNKKVKTYSATDKVPGTTAFSSKDDKGESVTFAKLYTPAAAPAAS